jgi:hypothetical protein
MKYGGLVALTEMVLIVGMKFLLTVLAILVYVKIA